MKDHDCVPLADFVELPPEEMANAAHRFLARMRTRHTIRAFSERPVAREIIDACVQTAGLAPSGANQQPWHFGVIGSPDIKRLVRIAAEEEERAFYGGKAGAEWLEALDPLGTDADKPFLERAPWLIAIFAQKRGHDGEGRARKNYYVSESVGIATGFLIAALHHAGLATLTHTPNPMTFLNDICGRPPSEKPYLLLVVGYPAPDATVPTHALDKKSPSTLATWL